VCRYIDDHFSTLANARPDIFTAGALNGFFGDMLTCSHVSSARNIVGGQLFRVSGNCDNIFFFFAFVSFDMWKDFGLLLPVKSFVSRKVLSPHHQQKTFRRSTRQKLCRGNARVDKERHKFDVFAESFPWSVQQSSEQQKFFPFENDVIFNVCSTFIFYPGKILKGSCSSAAGGGGSFVNGYGSRNMFGAPDATPEVDFFFFLM
jgi:hypothetical protein